MTSGELENHFNNLSSFHNKSVDFDKPYSNIIGSGPRIESIQTKTCDLRLANEPVEMAYNDSV